VSDPLLDTLSRGCEETGATLTAECVNGTWAACALINMTPQAKVGMGVTLSAALLDLCGRLGWKVKE
jgi:hypothetical protein